MTRLPDMNFPVLNGLKRHNGVAPSPADGRIRIEDLDVDALARALQRSVKGEVRFDAGSRATYSTDASNYRQVPVGVVLPRDVRDVTVTVAICRAHGVPITSRGGGTSLAGQACNTAVILDFSKYMHRVLEIDPERRLARVEPGCNLDTLRNAAEAHGLTFGPDPATHNRNTLGGMIGNNSCGVHSVMAQCYGPGPLTEHSVEALEVLTYDGARFTVGKTSEDQLEKIISAGGPRGRIYRALRALRDDYAEQIRAKYPRIPRRVSGYNLPSLLPENDFNVARALVGTEGTCVVLLSATLKLIPTKPKRTLVVLGYPDVYRAGDHVPEIMQHKPTGLEGLDDKLIGYMKKKGLHPEDVDLLPDGGGWLLVEFGGDTKDEADAQAKELMDALKGRDDAPSMKLFRDRWEEQKLWQVRESGLGATAHVPGMDETYPGWEDAAVAPENVGRYLRDFRKLLDRYDYDAALYGHFGQGCIHCRIDFDLKSHDGVKKWLAFLDEAADLVVSCGGSLSGEHGDGQARAALLSKMYGDELVEAFRRFKGIWDSKGMMNPGKVVDPYAPDENLRTGPDYEPAAPATYFAFAEDDGNFARAAARCVGVGLCRRDTDKGGTMCPSYRATREEEDSTRGRARLLFEMLQGDVVADGWDSDEVREALDLCLACKACKHECPVNVDMATYKAEFYAHYYRHRPRPVVAYGMGLIYWWARLASRMPRFVNFITRTEPFAAAFKRLGGIAPERRVPAFAGQPFTAWFKTHRAVRRPPAGWQPKAVAKEVMGRVPGASHDAGGDGAPLRHADVPRFKGETYGPPSKEDEKGTFSLNRHGKTAPRGHRRILLWPDTFNNYLKPQTARAAVEVLESIGYEVDIPPRSLCCGRPLYDWGMLDLAKHLWEEVLDTLRPYIRAGVPLVGLEPSCVAAFRDELTGLFPDDEDARRLSRQTYLLSEFLEQEDVEIPSLKRKAVVHGHCHHKAVMHMDAEVALLKKLGLDYDLLDAGCCGMAGAFGFDADHYDVSIACGERVLLPAVREADDETLIIANGFSCREQIEQTTERQALHIAEVLQMAFEHGPEGPAGRPEATVPAKAASRSRRTRTLQKAAVAGFAGVALGIAWHLLRR